MITPIRGRKQEAIKKKSGFAKKVLLKDDNPDKGTETISLL